VVAVLLEVATRLLRVFLAAPLVALTPALVVRAFDLRQLLRGERALELLLQFR
jgi:hypothetical protein